MNLSLGDLRYVERNQVRARMVRKAENYHWSSASAHCQFRQDHVLTKKSSWRKQFEAIGRAGPAPLDILTWSD